MEDEHVNIHWVSESIWFFLEYAIYNINPPEENNQRFMSHKLVKNVHT